MEIYKMIIQPVLIYEVIQALTKMTNLLENEEKWNYLVDSTNNKKLVKIERDFTSIGK